MSTTLTPSWRGPLDSLPATPDKIPAFFFAHGSPMLSFMKATPDNLNSSYMGEGGVLYNFLADFGSILLEKYQPKGIVVFSAHWETDDTRLVTDYGDENPLLYDYYGFPKALYNLQFKSRGDTALAQRVVDLYTKAGHKSRLTPTTETRGSDGRGFEGPGLDHGVFVPFRIMFGEVFKEIPIVEVSMDASLDPEKNWQIGKAVAQLREEGILVLSGGLIAHNLRDRSCFIPSTASELHKSFDRAVHEAIQVKDAAERKKALVALPSHHGFRSMHPRAEHFVPIYVAAGAGDGGNVLTLGDMYGIPTFAFGV